MPMFHYIQTSVLLRSMNSLLVATSIWILTSATKSSTRVGRPLRTTSCFSALILLAIPSVSWQQTISIQWSKYQQWLAKFRVFFRIHLRWRQPLLSRNKQPIRLAWNNTRLFCNISNQDLFSLKASPFVPFRKGGERWQIRKMESCKNTYKKS